MARGARSVPLPSPSVAFEPDFVRRLERLEERLEARASRRDGAGRGSSGEGGLEFVGYRPYRPGEDLRHLDWGLLGRLDRAFVKVLRREAGEHWAVLVDGSASMGTGVPGKLQWAAELAAALASIGVRHRAAVEITVSGPRPWSMGVRKKPDLWAWMKRVQTVRAEGELGVAALCEPARVRGADRVFAVGDWLGSEVQAVQSLLARGRELCAVCVLAPEELAPEPRAFGGPVEWTDPESGAAADVVLDRALLARYEQRIDREVERARAFCRRHRIVSGVYGSQTAFESAVDELLGGAVG